MKSTFVKMTYAFCTYVIGKNNVRALRTVAPYTQPFGHSYLAIHHLWHSICYNVLMCR